jgi:hypothetical protein
MPWDLLGDKVRIVTDPSRWPTDTFGGRGTFHHIQYEQRQQPPEAFWSVALPKWGADNPKARSGEDWWKDLSIFDRSLTGWALAGHGDMPTTILSPLERHRRGRKLAFSVGDWLAAHLPFGTQGAS